jgi:ribosomal protein S18 acetylase RimI-like enzyme
MGKEPAPMLADYSARIAAGEVHVLDDGGEAVGFVVLRPDADALFIENVAVEPATQRKGHGQALLEFAEREARRLGLLTLRLYTNAAMTENVAYYLRHGFCETERRDDEGYERVFFEKRLG